MKKIINVLLILTLLISGLSIFTLNVSAVSYDTTFEDGTVSQVYNNDWITSFENNNFFEISSYGTARSGTKTLEVDSDTAKYMGYMNYTYSSNVNLTNWEIYINASELDIDNKEIRFYFFNGTEPYNGGINEHMHLIDAAIIHITLRYVSTSNTYNFSYFDYSAGTLIDVGSVSAGDGYHKIGFDFNAKDTVNYYINSTELSGDPKLIKDNWRISQCMVYADFGAGDQVLLDDHSIDVGTSSDDTPSGSGCPDFSSYDNLYNFPDVFDIETLALYNYKYLEFIAPSPITAQAVGFEFPVAKQQLQMDPNLNNYGLYVNGTYVGVPQCYRFIDANTALLAWEFEDENILLNNNAPVFELFHDYDSDSGITWYNRLYDYRERVGPPQTSETIQALEDSHINGFLDIGDDTPSGYGPLWILYYKDFDLDTTNPNYNNTLGLLDATGQPLNTHPTYGTPFSYRHKTVFFDVYVDKTDYFKLNVYKDGSAVGYSQFFPKDIYTYHKQYGFVPYDTGNYTVSLYDEAGYFLNRTFYVETANEDFAIWTFPNPSKKDSTINVGVYASNPDRYSYYGIGFYSTTDNINDYSNLHQIEINRFTDNYFFVETDTYVGGGAGSTLTVYFRLFASNSTVYFPISGIHKHLVVSNLLLKSNIETSLGGDIGHIDEVFEVYGNYVGSISDGGVFLNNELIYEVGSGGFSFDYSFDTAGTYTFYLKSYYNGTWFTDDFVTVQISSESLGEEEGILPKINTQLGFIVGLLITLFLLLAPMIVLKGLGLKQTVPPITFAITACLGIAISVMLGFFPFWIIPFIVIIGILVLTVQYLIKDNGGAE